MSQAQVRAELASYFSFLALPTPSSLWFYDWTVGRAITSSAIGPNGGIILLGDLSIRRLGSPALALISLFLAKHGAYRIKQ